VSLGNLLRFWGQGASLVSLPVAGQPAVLAFTGRELAGVLVFPCARSSSRRSMSSGDPRKLDFLSSQLTPWPRRAVRARHAGLAGVTIRGYVSSLLVPPSTQAAKRKEKPDELTT